MKKKLFTLCSLFVLALSFVYSSCKKPSPDDPENKEPGVFAKGTPLGAPVQKMIGSAGGEISTTDGRIKVTVPAGAVSTETAFSIQPISSTALNSSDTSYRLLPEGKFAKDVTITFQYTDKDLEGTAVEAMYMAYQTQEGYWKLISDTEIDKVNKTISVKSDHFSDWGMIEEVRVEADKDTLAVNEATRLKISRIDITNDNLLAPIAIIVAESDISWKMVGSASGQLTTDGGIQATYQAPATVPSTGPVETIETTIKNLPFAGKRAAKLIIFTPVTILGNFMKISYNGLNTFIENVSILTGGFTIITGQLSSGFSVSLFCQGTGARSYQYGNVNTPGNGSITVTTAQGAQFNTNYGTCPPPGTPGETKYSNGSILISQWGEIGQVIKGSFSGPVYRHMGCPVPPEESTLTGEFQVVRTF